MISSFFKKIWNRYHKIIDKKPTNSYNTNMEPIPQIIFAKERRYGLCKDCQPGN